MACWKATVLTLFPEMFPGPLSLSITGRALAQKRWSLEALNIRDFAVDKHKTVDDTPYGGGVGMVMKPDVIHGALQAAYSGYEAKPGIFFLSPRGKPLAQQHLRSLTRQHTAGAIFLCGRYEGIDERVIDYWRTHHGLEEVSIGDFVLTGGELPAMAFIDAWVRLLPGVLEKEEATLSESFELDLLEFPQYTKPRIWQDTVVPEVLLSGDHQKIAAWRQHQAEQITQKRRPDVWQAFCNKIR